MTLNLHKKRVTMLEIRTRFPFFYECLWGPERDCRDTAEILVLVGEPMASFDIIFKAENFEKLNEVDNPRKPVPMQTPWQRQLLSAHHQAGDIYG